MMRFTYPLMVILLGWMLGSVQRADSKPQDQPDGEVGPTLIERVIVDTRSYGLGPPTGARVEIDRHADMRRVRARQPREESAVAAAKDVEYLFRFVGAAEAFRVREKRVVAVGYDMPAATVSVQYADGSKSEIENTALLADPGPLEFWATVRIVEGLASTARWE